MLFGSISYLNLLPFQIFLQRYISHNGASMSFRYKRAVPSEINKALRRGSINAAFISSVESRRYRCADLGIIADGSVYSVLLIDGEDRQDPASATSNALSQRLSLKGRVLIGDAALQYYLNGGEALDLSLEWKRETGLPFVFARLCFNRYDKYMRDLVKAFRHSHQRIPQYILKREAKKRAITTKQLLWYLEHIHYDMDYRAKRSLKLFLDKS